MKNCIWIVPVIALFSCGESPQTKVSGTPYHPLHSPSTFSQNEVMDSLLLIEKTKKIPSLKCEVKNEKLRRQVMEKIYVYDEAQEEFRRRLVKERVADTQEKIVEAKKDLVNAEEESQTEVLLDGQFVEGLNKLGNKIIFDHDNPWVKASENSWDQVEYESWKDLHEKITRLEGFRAKYEDTDENEKMFFYLIGQMKDEAVRVLMNDQNRIVGWGDFYFSAETKDSLKRLQQLVLDCRSDKCDLGKKLALASVEDRKIWKHVSVLNFALNKVQGMKTGSWGWRIALLTLSEELKMYGAKHSLSPMKSVERTGEGTWKIKLSSEDFSGHEEILESWFKKAWSNEKYVIDVEWIYGSHLFETVFNLLYVKESSLIAHVDQLKELMRLPPQFSVSTYIHEMGHALGLPDEYYTLWNADECRYVQTHNYGNLMSYSSSGGKVLDKHWNELKGAYPLNPPSKRIRGGGPRNRRLRTR